MIQSNEYFFEGHALKDCGRIGVLLIHGLTGTPNEMKMVGKGLNRAGFTVYGMQLAGHCGDVADLNQTSWQDWYASVEVAAKQLKEKVDHVFVAGLSMGALLALKLAADQPKLIAGVGVYGPTFRYDGWSIPRYARYLNFLLIWFKKFNVFQNGIFIEQPPYGLKDERLRARVAASMFSGDSAAAGLAGNPYPALAEMLKLSALVRHQLPNVTAPCLLIHASEDDVANVSNSLLVQKKISAESQLVLLEDSYHLITIDREYKKVIDHSVTYFKAIAEKSVQVNPDQVAA
ncbi:alpha/beta hydrolase [Aquirhabdus parva]|uniref:Alpha/beta fold hydrolase n=1 Tax=Aquirhabdus parva TaxID=2283318 RepID=A0A345P548_9GAMM|nr:alpha/beta fold hydrolase [Aquirhabdus parva]AXI02407.1 alpha/beta fold hydrolase [Aquirhabdus parva]